MHIIHVSVEVLGWLFLASLGGIVMLRFLLGSPDSSRNHFE